MNNQKAIVVFSGGQDSTTPLFWARQKFEQVESVTFQYGKRHFAEFVKNKTLTCYNRVKGSGCGEYLVCNLHGHRRADYGGKKKGAHVS